MARIFAFVNSIDYCKKFALERRLFIKQSSKQVFHQLLVHNAHILSGSSPKHVFASFQS